MKKILPEKLTGFSKAVADLCLLHDGTPEWLAEPKVREAWHWLFLSVVSYGILLVIVRPFFAAVFPRMYDTSETFALIDRSVWAASVVGLIGLLVRLGYVHFFYLILTGKDLRLKSIGFFFITGILLFSKLHFYIYCLFPAYYDYPNPPAEIKRVLTIQGIDGFQMFFDFLVYSACITLTLDNPIIKASSNVVSTIEFSQALLALIAFSLLLGSLIQRLSRPRSSR